MSYAWHASVVLPAFGVGLTLGLLLVVWLASGDAHRVRHVDDEVVAHSVLALQRRVGELRSRVTAKPDGEARGGARATDGTGVRSRGATSAPPARAAVTTDDDEDDDAGKARLRTFRLGLDICVLSLLAVAIAVAAGVSPAGAVVGAAERWLPTEAAALRHALSRFRGA